MSGMDARSVLFLRAGPTARRAPDADTRHAADPASGSAAITRKNGMRSSRAVSRDCAASLSDGAFHQAPGLAFEFEPRILM